MTTTTLSPTSAKSVRTAASLGRKEYIEVEPGVRLHITDLGEGKPVVLIHGWPLSNAMYEYQYSALVDRGYRVIGITLRGFGFSDKPFGRYDYDVYADDIKVVLEALGMEEAALGGFSMGGAISIHFVAKYPGQHVEKLLLFGAAAPIWTQRPDFPYNLPTAAVADLIALNHSNRPQLLEDFGKIFAAHETALSAGMAQWLGIINYQASPYAMAQSLMALRDTDLREALGQISIPTAIFHGRHDKICPFVLAEQMHERIKDSRIIAFEKSGHALFVEEREKFNAELIHFLSI